MNFVEISSESGPLLLNLEHVTSVQVGQVPGGPSLLLLGLKGVGETAKVPCPDAQQVYEFLREQLRPTSFVVKKPDAVGFAAQPLDRP